MSSIQMYNTSIPLQKEKYYASQKNNNKQTKNYKQNKQQWYVITLKTKCENTALQMFGPLHKEKVEKKSNPLFHYMLLPFPKVCS